MSVTVFDKNIDISTQIHDFTSKNKKLNLVLTDLNESKYFWTSGEQVIIPIELNIDLHDEVSQSSIHGMNHVYLIFSKSTQSFWTNSKIIIIHIESNIFLKAEVNRLQYSWNGRHFSNFFKKYT